mmetsp:Transcript_22988/g.33613  ORF Transcript_22988/g.33613 Transcript_22988/m.33613 type:complete len:128 (+) Transcript_22988:99-482(+)|eukprot:CAMPEP_0185025118 /NCGR_PEP_ID=MMETSP1103-20130426/8201_1 /TAXON_ID=36769 /ORGANISM="Paraphysomonas bandaiensis, Strain Caron Lab Isolate" /LENGTH=127 /DNA_ID=CAMNT_0027558245 /DNA_START=84 /DNA_END=467 /DNA_ORIENTATION=+
MSSDPRENALNYLKEKKVLQLFEILGARLAFVKPEQPNEFLLEELKRIQEQKSKNEPVTLFAEQDLVNMFSIFDITGRGYVTQLQYARALEAVGVDPTTAQYTPSDDAIDKSTFVKHLGKEIMDRAL